MKKMLYDESIKLLGKPVSFSLRGFSCKCNRGYIGCIAGSQIIPGKVWYGIVCKQNCNQSSTMVSQLPYVIDPITFGTTDIKAHWIDDPGRISLLP